MLLDNVTTQQGDQTKLVYENSYNSISKQNELLENIYETISNKIGKRRVFTRSKLNRGMLRTVTTEDQI